MRNNTLKAEELKEMLESLSEYILGQYNRGFDYGKQTSIIYDEDKNRKAKIRITAHIMIKGIISYSSESSVSPIFCTSLLIRSSSKLT